MKPFITFRQIPFLVTLSLLVGCTLLHYFFTIRHLMQATCWVGVPVTALSLLSFIIVLKSFFKTSFVDPGIFPRELEDPPPVDPLKVTSHIHVRIRGQTCKLNWCETCRFYRPPRCSHCSICDNCVEGFDHHCPWVDNCVGKRNYKFFFSFLVSLSVHLVLGCVVCIVTVVLYRDQLLQVVMEFILIVFITTVLIFILPLLGFHCGLVLMGRNTHEHVTGKFNSQNPNPFDFGAFSNCLTFSCGPQQPKYIRYMSKSANQITERYRTVSGDSPSIGSSRLFEPNSSLQLNTLDSSISGNSIGNDTPIQSPDHGHNNTYINLERNATPPHTPVDSK